MDDNFRKLRKYLIELAKKGQTDNYEIIVRYSKLDFELSADKSKLTEYLNEITEFEYNNGRPLITVFAVSKSTMLPKEYFFVRVKNKKIYPEYVTNNDIYRIERHASTQFWRDFDNIKKFYEV